MADIFDSATRSYVMSRIRGKDTRPELLVRKYLFAQGFRYRLHDRKLPGTPDIVLKKYKAVIFIHGCFWHGHEGCKYFKIPDTNTEWWAKKIQTNREHDVKALKELGEKGWKVFIIWECQLKPKRRQQTLEDITQNIIG